MRVIHQACHIRPGSNHLLKFDTTRECVNLGHPSEGCCCGENAAAISNKAFINNLEENSYPVMMPDRLLMSIIDAVRPETAEFCTLGA